MTTSPRSHPSTSRPDPQARVIGLLQREVRPLAPATLWHTCGVGNGVLALMVERGQLERTDRGLLQLPWRKPRQ